MEEYACVSPKEAETNYRAPVAIDLFVSIRICKGKQPPELTNSSFSLCVLVKLNSTI